MEGGAGRDQLTSALRAELARTTLEGRGTVGHQVPTKALIWLAVAIIALGGGGVIGEHFLGRIGQVTATTLARPASPARGTSPGTIGVKVIDHVAAAPFTLQDSSGHPWTLSQSRGRITLVTFLDANCADVCPVEGAEIRQALTDLGPLANSVTVDIVNTNPRDLNPGARVPALVSTHLSDRTNIHFLTGSLRALNSVWSNYGVQVKLGSTAGEVAHNNLLYFIDPTGQLVGVVTPLTQESLGGTFSLPATQVSTFARGIAAEITSLSR